MTQIIEKGCIMPPIITERLGLNFAVRSTSITLFDLQARRVLHTVVTGGYLEDVHALYLLDSFVMTPKHYPDIIADLRNYEAAGKLQQARKIIIDNRTAVFLYFQGVIKLIDFSGAGHAEIDGSQIHIRTNPTQKVPIIVLRPVQLGSYLFPLYIVSERIFGAHRVAALGENDEII